MDSLPAYPIQSAQKQDIPFEAVAFSHFNCGPGASGLSDSSAGDPGSITTVGTVTAWRIGDGDAAGTTVNASSATSGSGRFANIYAGIQIGHGRTTTDIRGINSA